MTTSLGPTPDQGLKGLAGQDSALRRPSAAGWSGCRWLHDKPVDVRSSDRLRQVRPAETIRLRTATATFPVKGSARVTSSVGKR